MVLLVSSGKPDMGVPIFRVAVVDDCIDGLFSGSDPVAMDRAVMLWRPIAQGPILARPAGDRAHDVEAIIRGLFLSCGNFLLHVAMVRSKR
jgi:hypothetical protein